MEKGQVNKRMEKKDNKYEVILSFDRDDVTEESFSLHLYGDEVTVGSFSLHLYATLRKAKISVFKDDTSIELLQSIVEGSKILIIIFSKRYASSKRCLEELTKIMEFRKAYDQVVIPIFYGVNRSHVLKQESGFGKAFEDLIEEISPTHNEVSRWRTALSQAGCNYGFDMFDHDYGKRWPSVQNIVEHVRQILDREDRSGIEGLVGVKTQVKEVITMLQKHQSKDFVSIGLWGMGGSGKTTIARLVFEYIQYEFERRFFLSNVKETWEKKQTLDLYRKLNLLSGIIVDEVEAEEVGERSASQTKVLIVVDDVNDLNQLYELRENRYYKGSRVIITTRDLHLLKAFNVDLVYSMKLLNDHESLQLFCTKAFENTSPNRGDFTQLSRMIVDYAEGLPLALEVFGSFLAGKSLRGWESAMMKLSTSVPTQIYNTLKLSFDYLDNNKKEIFLNIV